MWAINALGDIVQCDRIFHMDDVRVQEIRAKAAPDSNIAAMLEWMRVHPGPIYTSRLVPGYPGLVEFPLQAVIRDLGSEYLNNTAAFAAALAIHSGVGKLSLFGCDYTYADAHYAERGRGCLEYWLGIAHARGIEIAVDGHSTLLDALEPRSRRIYGYDLVDIVITGHGNDAEVSFRPRDETPTAAEIERRYDHSRHPNSLVIAKG